MTKVTFTLDSATISRLELAAERLARPKSQVVREAIRDYSERVGRLSEAEKRRMLRILDEIAARPKRPHSEVEAELRELRRARRAGGRRTPAE